MNYRHAFHAGNAGDVLKHLVLAWILRHMQAKPGPVTVLDTHAGAGRYRLQPNAGEWREGIGRLMRHPAADWPEVAATFREAVMPGMTAEPASYPGSPAIALDLLRPQDRLIACETEEDVVADLKWSLGGDPRAGIHARDGWGALRAFLPPKAGERSLVLIDPPYEAADEFDLLKQHLLEAARRSPTAIIIGWYPVKGRASADRLRDALAFAPVPKMLAVELLTQPDDDPRRFAGSGLVVIRPPWRLDQALRDDLPKLLALMGHQGTGSTSVDWLTTEDAEFF